MMGGVSMRVFGWKCRFGGIFVSFGGIVRRFVVLGVIFESVFVIVDRRVGLKLMLN